MKNTEKTKRLSLDDFKKSMENESKELESLLGGVLGDCHCPNGNDGSSPECPIELEEVIIRPK
ncbi:hypothetical protein [Chishuiella sp.]|uniref:hypothetical protein n=1 Tax=Chishuiella sp. TaxID=1969467 RepID=UPI0028AD9882|nr:hypothetical protein [Chishuiella sp.]